VKPVFSHPDAVERHTLPNGLRVVMQSDGRLPLVALELCIEAGSRHEPPHLGGLAHLCEHLAFRGISGDAPGLPTVLQSRGATSNATTFHGRTCFRDLLPSGELDAGLWAAARRLADHDLPEDEQMVSTQRRVLLAEHRQRSENRRLLAELQRLLYDAEHPYHRSPVGEPEGLRRLTRNDVVGFLTDHYVPERTILVLAGDLRPAEAVPRIEETLGVIPRGGSLETRGDRPTPSELPTVEQRRVVASPAPTVRTSVASRAPGYGHRLWYATELAAHALTDRASPLHRELIDEKGLAHALRVSLVSLREASTVVLTATAAPDIERQHLERALLDGAARLLRRRLPEAVVHRALKAAVKSHYFKMQTLEYRASLAARLTCNFDAPERLAEEARRYGEVTTEDVAALGETLFQPGNRVSLTMVPGEVRCRT
jgi:zinc protease